MAVSYVLFIVGFFILIKGADVLVKGAAAVSRYLGVSGWIVGLLVAGIGTSIPEFAVFFTANLSGRGGISWGTILGSNIFNLLFITGLAALIHPLVFRRDWVARDLVANIAAVVVVWLLVSNSIGAAAGVSVTKGEGLVLTALLVLWLYYVFKASPRINHASHRAAVLPLTFVMIIAGLAGVILGGKWVVDGAVLMAKDLGWSSAFVGLTVVSIGTSLPELAVSAVAAFRKNPGLAIGNVVGSNIFDFLGIVGLSALARPIILPPVLEKDIAVMVAAAAAVLFFAITGRKFVIQRSQGAVMILAYLAYFGYLVFRG